ncbi:MAG TPA: deoxyribose-phosphate aldolase [Acholeplasma sp.]|jgi:deoxyribose-phosphate aldolase
MNLNSYIDHTKLGPVVTKEAVDSLIAEAKKYQFKSVCVTPIWVSYAKEQLKDSGILVCTVIGFPHGSHLSKVKAYETKLAVLDGADEIDMVINVTAVKEKNRSAVMKDIKGVVKNAQGRTVKVIIETALLDQKEITWVSKLVIKAGAQFVKTSTGYASRGASLDDVKIIRKAIKDTGLIKASGGIRTKEDALNMIKAGANRLGTSQGVKLIEGEQINGNTSY